MVTSDYSLKKIKEKKTILSFSMYPLWEMVPLVRHQIKRILLLIVGDVALVDKIAMSASELLENSVKYTNHDQITFRLDYQKRLQYIDLTVANKSTVRHAKQLLSLVKAMKTKDQESFYLQKLMEKHVDQTISHKGIARINYETGQIIKMSYNKEKWLTVKLRFTLLEEKV